MHLVRGLMLQVIIAGGISPSTKVGDRGYTNFAGYIHFAAGLAAGVHLPQKLSPSNGTDSPNETPRKFLWGVSELFLDFAEGPQGF